jgi:23S rRNA pseudouridine2605 synthase
MRQLVMLSRPLSYVRCLSSSARSVRRPPYNTSSNERNNSSRDSPRDKQSSTEKRKLVVKPTRLPTPGSHEYSKLISESQSSSVLNAVKSKARVGIAGEGQRLNKFLSHAGVAVGRRAADVLIETGRVSVNDYNDLELGYVLKASDVVCLDGNPVKLPYAKPSEARVWVYNKPRNQVVTTARHPESESKDKESMVTVFDFIKKTYPKLPKLTAVGRLDAASEGLLLFSNNPNFCRMMELPKSGFERVYRVRVFGRITEKGLNRLEKGIRVEGIHYSPMKIQIDKKGTNSWLQVTIKEGRNREVRKAMEAVGLQVTRLIRIRFGPYELGSVPEGGIKEVALDYNLKKNLEVLTQSK